MAELRRARGLVVPDWLDLLLRFLVGGTFAYASFDKILHPEAFAQAVYNYRLLPLWLLHPFALVLPWLELVTGVALVAGRARRGAAALVCVLLVMFMAAITVALHRGIDISCGCFHTTGGHAIGLSLLFRDLALLAGAAVLLATRRLRRSF